MQNASANAPRRHEAIKLCGRSNTLPPRGASFVFRVAVKSFLNLSRLKVNKNELATYVFVGGQAMTFEAAGRGSTASPRAQVVG